MDTRVSGLLVLAILVFAGCAAKQQKRVSPSDIAHNLSAPYYYLVSKLKSFASGPEAGLPYLEEALAQDPSSVGLLLEKAYFLARSRRIPEAMELAEKAVRLAPQNADVHILLGQLYSAQNQSAKAIAEFVLAQEIDPQLEDSYSYLAREYVSHKKPREAIAVLESFLKIRPDGIGAYYLLANIYLQDLKDTRQALVMMRRLLDEDPTQIKAYEIIGQIELEAKNYDKALASFQIVERERPGDLGTQLKIALLYYELKRLDEAIARFQDILKSQPGSDRIQYYLGLLSQEKADLEGALGYFEAIQPVSGFFVDAVARQIIIRKNQGDLAQAAVIADGALAQKGDKLELYELAASVAISQDDFPKAIGILETGLKKWSNHPRLLENLALIYDKMGQWEKGVEMMRQILKTDAKNATALNFIGYSYADHNVRLAEARQLIEQANRIRPNDGYILDSLGWVYYRMGQVNQALATVKEARQKIPDETTILEHLGDIYVHLKNKRAARSLYEKILYTLESQKFLDQDDRGMLHRVREKLANF